MVSHPQTFAACAAFEQSVQESLRAIDVQCAGARLEAGISRPAHPAMVLAVRFEFDLRAAIEMGSADASRCLHSRDANRDDRALIVSQLDGIEFSEHLVCLRQLRQWREVASGTEFCPQRIHGGIVVCLLDRVSGTPLKNFDDGATASAHHISRFVGHDSESSKRRSRGAPTSGVRARRSRRATFLDSRPALQCACFPRPRQTPAPMPSSIRSSLQTTRHTKRSRLSCWLGRSRAACRFR